jgi:hypothetical protein
LPHEELAALLVLRVVSALAVEHLLELDRRREEVALVVQLDRAFERLRRRRRGEALSGSHLEVFAAFFACRRRRVGNSEVATRATKIYEAGASSSSSAAKSS